jgi:Zn-dependent peptidase ImmA (M78 family)/DNA-binding XRE family transcriptional regulator
MNDSEINRQMLVLARESRGLTQQELAQAITVKQGYISKIEGGLLNVSDEYLVKIAEVLEYPKEFFFQPDEVRGVGSACNYHRKRESLTLRNWHKITARLNILRLHISKLLRGVDTEHENDFYYLDSDEYKPEQVARLIRKYWKIPSGPIANLIAEIENAGAVVYLLPFGTDKLDAISQSVPGMPPLFLVNSEIPGDRCRFTLAHELGHIIMHNNAHNENMEAEADRFAAEFLMPAKDIADDLASINITKAANLKPYWKVSIASLIRRAKDLKKINADQYVNLFKQLSYYGYRKNEPVKIPLEQPTVLKDTIQVYLSDYGYDIAALAKFLNLYENEAQKEFVPTIGGIPFLRVV